MIHPLHISLLQSGGLSTSFTALKAHIGLSMVVATTGVVMPIGISFCLKSLVSASPLQAFAAGVALCSTSLGTTLTILSTSGLSKTPLGTVITGAAMLDDIAGLVLVQVVSNLSASRDTISVATILRPILVSLGFVVVVVLGCKYVISPLTQQIRGRASPAPPFAKLARNLPSDSIAFCFHTTTLFALVVSATYAGTSPLFAAYVVGATINWWDEKFSPDSRKEDHDVHGPPSEVPEQSDRVGNTSMTTSTDITSPDSASELSIADIQNSILSNDTATRTENGGISVQDETSTGVSVYERYYLAVVERILKPFFFVCKSPPFDLYLFIQLMVDISGFDWIRYPDHRDVRGVNCVARTCLRSSDGCCKGYHRSMANKTQHQAFKSFQSPISSTTSSCMVPRINFR